MQYDTRDGLAGSTVYDLCQDKEGFMWFATENGVSRYDGTSFKNFTTKDGLPDLEVLLIYGDRNGRVWMAPFGKSVCYYYKGKIYNQENNPLLAEIKFTSRISFLDEDIDGNIMMIDDSKIFILSEKGEVKEVASLVKITGGGTEKIFYAKRNPNGPGFILHTAQKTYLLKNDSLKVINAAFIVPNPKTLKNYPSSAAGKTDIYKIEPGRFFFSGLSSGRYDYINTDNGSYEVDKVAGITSDVFLRGKKVTNTIEDNEENLWFSTIGEGVYRLPSKRYKNFTFLDGQEARSEIFSLGVYKESILAGSTASKAFFLNLDTVRQLNFSKYLPASKVSYQLNRLYCLKALSTGEIILGFDGFLIKLSPGDKVQVSPVLPVKCIEEINRQQLLVGTSYGVVRVNTKDLSVIDTIWKERATKVLYHDRQIYIGTLSGLHRINPDKTIEYLGDLHPALKRRITDIKVAGDGTFFVSTSDLGVVLLKNDKVLQVLDTESGLSSDICKTLFLEKDVLWVGTAKGLNKVDISNHQFPVMTFNVADGLPSENINAIYVKDSLVWVGTPAGLTYFNPNNIARTSRCMLRILKIQSSGADILMDHPKKLLSENNNISFDFIGISFKSGGDILYKYQLQGLDNKWHETRQHTITYPALPPGNYTFNLSAINKFGVESEPYNFSFSIAAPWWQSVWLVVLLVTALVGLVWWLANLRYRILTRRREEKINFQQRIADLEQLALRAQMNPHFIFNCLNSIQNFIINQDLEATNKYMNSFAWILRQTLEQSTRKVISVAEEVAYITTYLDLEKMRFGDKFIYKIDVDKGIPQDFTFIPNMILQPFVENSIRHGILYKNGEQGLIEVCFVQTADTLICTIQDNGIGRRRSREIKTDQHIEYHSKGIELTLNRLELLSGDHEEKVTTIISDVNKDDREYPGTLVKFLFPLSIIDKLNKQR